MNILVTGGCGFIGSNFINQRISRYKDNVINIDNLTYAGCKTNVNYRDEGDPKGYIQPYAPGVAAGVYKFYEGDITDSEFVKGVLVDNYIECIVHFAAESHVDRSIKDPEVFIDTNIKGTFTLLEAYHAHCSKNTRFVHISTDEVYGDLSEYQPAFTEESNIQPNSPYAASKAASDLLCRSYHQTYNLPVLITRCSNNYGPNQYPEKLIPLMIKNALAGKKLGVYGDGRNIRDWIHVDDHCEAIGAVLARGEPGEVYNIGGNHEVRNIDIVKMILKHLDLSTEMIEYIEDRKGHDWRYAMDTTKISTELDWSPLIPFATGLESVIDQYWSPTPIGELNLQ